MPESNEHAPNQQEPTVEFVVPDPEGGIFTTYANNIQVGFTIFDLRFVFGEIVETHSDKIVVEQRAQVTISYLQAKLLWRMIGEALTQQEARFGEIKLPLGAADISVSNTEAKNPPGTFTRG